MKVKFFTVRKDLQIRKEKGLRCTVEVDWNWQLQYALIVFNMFIYKFR